MTIELTQGRCVKWQDNGWHTGRVLGPENMEAFHGVKPVVLVRDTCTSKVFAVESSKLEDNTCRADERKAEAIEEEDCDELLEEAWEWFLGQSEIRLGKDGVYDALVDESGEVLCAGSSQDWVVLGFYRGILQALEQRKAEATNER